ncbi:hypothetical protein D6850_18195 [Roseovarius spongiae]|uniref:Uncharacterized protein n=1 Tax=Roseovarius spongiae TaxID=2320272 RepID=A0A3A8B738_9RHOB|nr:hypothetical protein D6850_18195 [Roseovarius spongiae]
MSASSARRNREAGPCLFAKTRPPSRTAPPRDPDAITLYKNAGGAHFDLLVAGEVFGGRDWMKLASARRTFSE